MEFVEDIEEVDYDRVREENGLGGGEDDVKQARMQEISRRVQSAKELKREKPVAATGTTNIQKNKYKFAIINKANRTLNPPCKRPAFRVLGFFESETGDFQNWLEDLRDCNQLYTDPKDGQTKCKLGDLHKLPLLQYCLIPKTSKRDRDEGYVKQKVEEIKGLHARQNEASKKEFDAHHERKQTGDLGLSLESQRKQATKVRKDKVGKARAKALEQKEKERAQEREVSREVGRVPKMMELTRQQCAAIIVLNDVTDPVLASKDDPEPALMLVDCFNSCQEAEEYIDNQLKHHVHSTNIDVVDLYTWHYPEDVDLDEVQEKYRCEEQNLIMREKKLKKKEVEEAESKMNECGNDAPRLEITEEHVAPEDFQPLKQNTEVNYTESFDKPLVFKKFE